MVGAQSVLLQLHEPADAGLRQVEQRVHFGARERRAFGGALDFDEAAAPVITTFMSVSQARVFRVVEVEHGHASYTPTEIAATKSRSGERASLPAAISFDTASCAATNAPVMRPRVPPSAWTSQSMLMVRAERFQIEHRAQRAADQALDLLRAAVCLPRAASRSLRASRARQHAVFGGQPALAAPRRKPGTVPRRWPCRSPWYRRIRRAPSLRRVSCSGG
jgi:hypothetical protein